MTSSVRFPSVALRSPPVISAVIAATDSVARLNSAANGTIAPTESTNNSVCASGATICAPKTAGTKISSQSSGVPHISLIMRVTVVFARA